MSRRLHRVAPVPVHVKHVEIHVVRVGPAWDIALTPMVVGTNIA